MSGSLRELFTEYNLVADETQKRVLRKKLLINVNELPKLDEIDENGNTCLHLSFNMILNFSYWGGNLFTDDYSALIKYVKTQNAININKDHDLLNELLDLGLNVNIYNDNGVTPLILAVCENNVKKVNLLIKYGSNVNVLSYNEMSPLLYAVVLNHTEIMKILIDNGHHLKERSIDCYLTADNVEFHRKQTFSSLLEAAIVNNRVEAAEILINSGIIIENSGISSSNGDISTAVCYENLTILKMIINAGGVIYMKHISRLLEDALESDLNSYEMFYYLLNYGVCNGMNINERDRDGHTVLHFAVEWENLKIVNALINEPYNADIDIIDNSGKTPLETAFTEVYDEMSDNAISIVNSLINAEIFR